MKKLLLFVAVLAIAVCTPAAQTPPANAVDVDVREAGPGQIDFLVKGQPVMSYYFGDKWIKPFIAPLRTVSGTRITRGYPMETIAGENTDHPHHTGMYFGYGDVNDHDYWAKSKEGARSIHQKVVSMDKKRNRAALTTELHWVEPTGKAVVRQTQTVELRAGRTDARILDVTEELTALAPKVVFEDTKEGMFAIRLREEFTEKGGGKYINAEGAETEKNIWGKRSKHVVLHGTVGDEKISVAILDHPTSFNHPTWWHARGYGLFAANPFGRKDFEKGAEPINHTIKEGETVRFKYRVVVFSGHLTAEQLAAEFDRYVRAVQ